MQSIPPQDSPDKPKDNLVTWCCWLSVAGLFGVFFKPLLFASPIALICGIIALRRIGNSESQFKHAMLGALAGGLGCIVLCWGFINFFNARSVAQTNACYYQLRQIDAAKNQCALECKLSPGTSVSWIGSSPSRTDDTNGGYLYPYLGVATNTNSPVCPSGGTYTFGRIGEKASCSIHGTY